MKWIANVDVHGVSPGTPNYSLFPIEADSATDAARIAANMVARAVHGPRAEAFFINAVKPSGFIAHVGLYQGHGRADGGSVQINLSEYRGGQ